MKIFNIENGRKVVYIEFQTISVLNLFALQQNSNFPDEYFKFLNHPFNFVDENLDFVKFTTPAMINYLKSLSWIIDYREVKDLSKNQIIKLQLAENEKLKAISKHLEERPASKNYYKLLLRSKLSQYRIHVLSDLLDLQNEISDLSFPIAPDYKSLKFTCHDCPYIAVDNIDQRRMLIFRKDEKQFSRNDVVSNEFIENSLSMIVMSRSENSKNVLKIEGEREFSSDRRYFIVHYNTKYFKKNENNQKVDLKFKSIVKTIFGKK